MFHPTLFRRMVFLLLLPVVIFSQNLKLLTPNGGIFNGGEKITISWEASSSIKAIILYFSLDKNVWYEIGSVGNTGSGGTYEWTAPYFKTEKKEVWVKIEAPEKKMADTTEISFTIRAAEPDAAEPNNSISTATVLEIGDTLSGVITMGYGGKPEGLYNIDTQTVYSDTDFFAIKVSSPTLLFISVLPDFGKRSYYEGYLGSRVPAIFLMDQRGNIIATNSREMDSILVAVEDSGSYYCGVLSGGIFSSFAAWYHKYKITVRGVAELKKLSVSQSAYLPYNDNYKFTVVDSNALLSLSVIAKEKKDGNITVARLPADSEVINFPPQKEPLSIVMIEASPVVDSVMDSVSIEVGYNKNMVSDTGTISVMWYNDSTGVWENVAFEKDLQNNKVIIGSKHLSIYGVFQRNSVSVTKERTKGGGELSFKVKSVSKQTIYIERGKEIVEKNIKVSLYSVNGKKILTSLIDGKIGREEKASLQLPYNLRKGVYILRIEGANTDKSISIPIVR
ncbi:MAG: hypothetical protein N2053_02265 [Chitinispirillaceae bacterium]|nr:hypothetical protein [Chitinispirillaceae bacterium]